jgi:hypothetical protein
VLYSTRGQSTGPPPSAITAAHALLHLHALLWQRGFGLRIHRRVSSALDRLATEWGACSVTCGVGKQQRSVRFASELCFRALACAPLDVARPAPSSTLGIRLVLPAVARLQRYGTRFGVPLLWSITAGWPASTPAINSALLPSTAP